MQAYCYLDRFCVSYPIVSSDNSSSSFFCLLGQWYPLPHLFFLCEQGSTSNLEVFYNQSKEKICGCWICKELKRERLEERFVQVSEQVFTSGRNRRALEILQEKLNEAQIESPKKSISRHIIIKLLKQKKNLENSPRATKPNLQWVEKRFQFPFFPDGNKNL